MPWRAIPLASVQCAPTRISQVLGLHEITSDLLWNGRDNIFGWSAAVFLVICHFAINS